MALIQLTNVNKIFQIGDQSYHALKDINLQINKGELVAIIGPSGSGKSTLMNILGLLDHPTSGQYNLDGNDTADLKEDQAARLRNQKIGFVFQNFNLLNRTSAQENVALPLIYAGKNKSYRLEKAKQILTNVGLGEKLHNSPTQLSGGQQQRVAIARALVNDPELILADEPTGNLDSKTGVEIMNLIKTLHQEGRTIVLITHSPEIAEQAKRVIQIRDGEIIEEGKSK